MASNCFGNIFKITTFGESHGKAIGVTIDGCPAGIKISFDDINNVLAKRAPGKNNYTSPRNEPDMPQILSGVFEDQTTGAPITIIIYNKDQDSTKYESIKNLLRPGHANYTYLKKYGIFDYRGGGRSSARETAARVAASAVAAKILDYYNVKVLAYIKSLHYTNINLSVEEIIARCNDETGFNQVLSDIYSSPIFCPDKQIESNMMELIENIRDNGDSLGGVIEFIILNSPIGLGDPVYEKAEARLAYAMMSIPASKGFEIGSGFNASTMLGSEHNDEFELSESDSNLYLSSNFAGGTLGGITNGMPIVGRVAFKPTSSIKIKQNTVDLNGKKAEFNLPEGSRHDPCVALRAVPVVSAMATLVMADLLLMNLSAKLPNIDKELN